MKDWMIYQLLGCAADAGDDAAAIQSTTYNWRKKQKKQTE
jgi:hypothetical protein